MNKYTRELQFDEQKHEYSVNGVKLPSITEIIGPITFTKYRVEASVIEQAAFRGSMIHEFTAMFDRGDLEDDTSIPVDTALYLKAWKDFCHDYQASWKFIELPLACNSMAGTVDRIGTIDGKTVVVDIKTTSSMDKASKIALCSQLYGYSILCEENDIPVDFASSMGVQLKKDGTYSVYTAGETGQKYGFNPAELFSQMKFLNNLIKGERKIVNTDAE